jgi:hydroxymethylglutaryl-CoA lyase
VPAEVDDLGGRPPRRLQNEPTVVPVESRSSWSRLLAAGLPVVEATSFVSPARVPQLATPAS